MKFLKGPPRKVQKTLFQVHEGPGEEPPSFEEVEFLLDEAGLTNTGAIFYRISFFILKALKHEGFMGVWGFSSFLF